MGVTVNSSISNSDTVWKRYFRILIIALIGLFAGGYIFIITVDPYGIFPFSLSIHRGFATDPRFFMPNLAKRTQFDSAIIGTSTIRLLNPEDLNPLFEGRFVNLGMNGAFLSEQNAILDVFLRYHPRPKAIVIGVDHLNFDKSAFHAKYIERLPEHFPNWLYDEKRANDLPPYNWRTIQHAIRQLRGITGMTEFKYRFDGYEDFTKRRPYDIDRARKIIYGSTTPKNKIPLNPPVQVTPEQIEAFKFPALIHLEKMLDRLPESTLKIVVVPPFHYYHQATPGTLEDIKWNEFKRRVATIVCRYPNIALIDFMIESPITTRDENFLDQIHYTVPVARKIARLLAKGAFSRADGPLFNRFCSNLIGAVN
jgi:hypothetical protein